MDEAGLAPHVEKELQGWIPDDDSPPHDTGFYRLHAPVQPRDKWCVVHLHTGEVCDLPDLAAGDYEYEIENSWHGRPFLTMADDTTRWLREMFEFVLIGRDGVTADDLDEVKVMSSKNPHMIPVSVGEFRCTHKEGKCWSSFSEISSRTIFREVDWYAIHSSWCSLL